MYILIPTNNNKKILNCFMNYCHHSVLQHYVVTMSPGRAIDFRLPHSQEIKLLADNI